MILDNECEKINEATDEPYTAKEVAIKWVKWGLNECAGWENILPFDYLDEFTPDERKAVNNELDDLRSILGKYLNDME